MEFKELSEMHFMFTSLSPATARVILQRSENDLAYSTPIAAKSLINGTYERKIEKRGRERVNVAKEKWCQNVTVKGKPSKRASEYDSRNM